MSILDTIKTIMDSETADFRAEQSASLASLTLAADNKFRAQAADRAEKELEIKLRQETSDDLDKSKLAIEIETQNEVDNLVDRYFKPLFLEKSDAYGAQQALDENTLNDAEYRTAVLTNMTDDYDFTSEQASNLYAVVSAYLVNPGQHTIVSGYINDILTGGNSTDYIKPFSKIGLYDNVTDQGVVSSYNLAKGNSVLARFSQLDNVSKDIDIEINELRNLGDRSITRQTAIPDTEINFNLGEAFNRQVIDEANTVDIEVKFSKETINSLNRIVQEQDEDGNITYTEDEKKQITVLLNDVLGGTLKDELGLNTGWQAKEGEVFGNNITEINKALGIVKEKRKDIERAKFKQTQKRNSEMTMYSKLDSNNPMNPKDIDIYGNLANVKFNSELEALNAVENIILRDSKIKKQKKSQKNRKN